MISPRCQKLIKNFIFHKELGIIVSPAVYTPLVVNYDFSYFDPLHSPVYLPSFPITIWGKPVREFPSYDRTNKETYRPRTATSHTSNLCTVVGGDQNKEFRGNCIIFEGKGPKGWNKNILLLYFNCYCILIVGL